MTRYMKLSLCLAALLSIPIIASAQGRIAARPAAHPMPMARSNGLARERVAARPIIIHVPAASARRLNASDSQEFSSPGISIFPNGNNGFIFPGATSFDLGQLLNNVPGLGFNYEFLDAMNQNLGERAFIDPVTQQDLALAGRLSQFGGTGFAGFFPFFGGGYYAEPAEEQQQPPVIVEQQQQPAPAAEEQEESSAAPAEEPAPLPDIGEFVLVLHNGDKIKAVAFTRQNDQIVYITKDGMRESFPAADLDAAATQQINQQRGAPLQLSL